MELWKASARFRAVHSDSVRIWIIDREMNFRKNDMFQKKCVVFLFGVGEKNQFFSKKTDNFHRNVLQFFKNVL